MKQAEQQQERKKKCRKCGEDKPLSDFSKHGSTADRLQNHCKKCEQARKREIRNGTGAYGGAF